MKFISVEEFLKQPKEVQEVFLKWWKPSIGDLFCDINAYNETFLDCIYNDDKKEVINIDKKHGYYIPLFTEGQLRKFIEDEIESAISELSLYQNGYKLIIGYKAEFIDGEPRTKKIFRNLGDNLLQAYWKVACKIAKESVE